MGLTIKREKKKNSSIYALIDGDMIAHPCANAADGRGYTIEGIDGVSFKYKNEAKEFCIQQQIAPSLITLSFNPDPVEWALHSVSEMIQHILDTLDTDMYRIFLTGEGNFRKELATIQDYKGNRKDARVPEHLQACRDHLISRWDAEVIDGQEADDMLGIKQISMQRVRHTMMLSGAVNLMEPCICTLDKDLNMIPGLHFNWNKDEVYEVDEVEAIRCFYYQLITGDSTDNIAGLSEKKPKRRTFKAKPLDKMDNEYDMLMYVSDGYQSKYGKDWEDALLENGRLLWIRRHPEEVWDYEQVIESKFTNGQGID